MRIRKDKMIKAIDHIITEHNKRQVAYDKALVEWKREQRAVWIRDMRPRYKQLQKLIAENSTGSKVVTRDMLSTIFAKGQYSNEWRLEPFDDNAVPPSQLKFEDGRKVYSPTGINVSQMQAMKKLLEAVEDDTVTDTVLSKLGVKDVTPIFRAAVELGGLVA